MMVKETHTRSITKSLVWRFIGILILPVIILGVHGQVGDDIEKVALWTTVSFHVIRAILYYLHERIWNKINWGRSVEIPQ